LLYVRPDVIGAIAPYGIAASQNVTIQVEYFGEKPNAIRLPVAGSAPALFTSDQSGTGPGGYPQPGLDIEYAAERIRRRVRRPWNPS
jgi:uncharacterized protein (TIGR03437 family)